MSIKTNVDKAKSYINTTEEWHKAQAEAVKILEETRKYKAKQERRYNFLLYAITYFEDNKLSEISKEETQAIE